MKKSSTARWRRFKMADGGHLTDAKWFPLLQEFQVLVYTMLYEPVEARPTAPGGLNAICTGIGSVAYWMSEAGYYGFRELNSAASWEYFEYYCSTLDDPEKKKKRRPKLTFSTATQRLKIFSYIYRQRSAMRRHGVQGPIEPPFDGRSVNDIVTNELGQKHPEKLLPIPDDVAIPILNASVRLMGIPADDVESLVNMCRPAFERSDTSQYDGHKRYKHVGSVLGSYKFGLIEGENEPWHGALEPYTRTMIGGRNTLIEDIQIVRRLLLAIQQAAIVTIQGCVGFRGNELCAIEVQHGWSEFPSCVERRISPDGYLELFYVYTIEHKVSKKRKEWLIASRPVGSNFVPPPLRAFQVLHRIFDPWRKFSGTNKLLLTFLNPIGLPRSSNMIGEMSTQQLTFSQKEFVYERVDLSRASEESREQFVSRHGIRNQQWRTTFAIFLVRIDSRFLGPVSLHFKNLSIALTSKAYVGNDVEYLSAIDDARATETARFFLEVVSGQRQIAGNMAKVVREHERELKDAVGLTSKSAKQFVLNNDLLIYNFSYGKCFVSFHPQKSLCNRLAGTNHWAIKMPNHMYRSPSVCAGCPVFGADASNRPFWKSRASDLRQSLGQDKPSEEIDDMRVVRKRLAQAEAFLRILSRR